MPPITAMLPAYNEEVSIGSVVLRARQYADRPRDDGSSDHTAEVASLAGAEVLRHAKNQGKGAALKTGFASLNGDAVIVTIDTDGQHDPADIPRLVAPILRDEADMGEPFSGQAKGVLELRRPLYSSSMRVHIPGYFAMNP